jgi:intraflagellar transport protein 172
VDWLELNCRATKLIFRDKRRQLHLYDIHEQQRTTLLNFCSYVQWVPNSDVVVAQNRGNLCVWYSIDAPERVTIFNIKGDVEDIERNNGRTEVVVDEGVNTVSYALDESLIEFGYAIEKRNYKQAVAILEALEMTPETEAMWTNLSNMALQDKFLSIAERCYAALGDMCKARYLHKINKVCSQVAASGGEPNDHYQVRAKLAALDKKYGQAESALLEQGKVDETIQMYQELHKWEEAIRVAKSKGHPDAESIATNYFQMLIKSKQEEKAGALKEQAGDIDAAINLYLQGGMPAKAAVLAAQPQHQQTPEKLETIATALSKSGLFEKAGEFYEKLNMTQKAMGSYRQGQCFRNAVDLARRVYPEAVVQLEEDWGDYLVQNKKVDMAINHYIEAGQYVKAVEAAISSRQWNKAVEFVDKLEPKLAEPLYRRIAMHYEETQDYTAAEKFYIKAGTPSDAVDMYSKANKWERVQRVAMTYMSEAEVTMLYIMQAQRCEAAGKLKEAEKLYLMVKEHDLAINMYKKGRQYDNMVRLVQTHRREMLVETYVHLAQLLETEGNYKEAEQYYIEAKDWKSAVNMYRANDLWDEAIRVAKLHGGPNASKQVAYAWAVHIGGEAGANLLTKFGLVEQAIDYATESGAFDQAFQLARTSLKSKLPEVHLKHAMFLEDEGHFKEAEEEFIKASKPKEAIDMYIHQQNWMDAMRVAEQHEPGSVADVLVAQGRMWLDRKDYQQAETLFLRAKKPDLAVKMYKESTNWNEVLRVAKEYLPHQLNQLNMEYTSWRRQNSGDTEGEDLTAPAKLWISNGEYSRAIDAYLRITHEHTQDQDFLEEIWENAVDLAMKHCHDRISEVVGVVCKRLIAIRRFEQAAALYEGIDAHKEAIDVYILGDLWDKAYQLAGSMAPQYVEYVKDMHKRHLMDTQNAASLVDLGDVGAGLDMYADRGDWDRCYELAVKQGPEVVQKYVKMHADRLVQDGQFGKAVHVFVTYGAPPSPPNFPVYKRLAKEILGRQYDPPANEPDYDGANELTELREMMFKLLVSMKNSGMDKSSAIVTYFERLLIIVHLASIKESCKNKGSALSELSAKASIALLRYVDEVPADKAFYEAGNACRQMGWQNASFVYLNRYLDLVEMMEDADNASMLENADFEKTDIPYDFPLPDKQFLPESKRNEVRDWVLQLSMDQAVDPMLRTRPCVMCATDIYEANLKCPSCKNEFGMCAVTGFPMERTGWKELADVTAMGMRAMTEDWNKYVIAMKHCPWSRESAAPAY